LTNFEPAKVLEQCQDTPAATRHNKGHSQLGQP